MFTQSRRTPRGYRLRPVFDLMAHIVARTPSIYDSLADISTSDHTVYVDVWILNGEFL